MLPRSKHLNLIFETDIRNKKKGSDWTWKFDRQDTKTLNE